MPAELRPIIGLVTIGQSPRVDIVPEMAAVIGPDVEVREARWFDALPREMAFHDDYREDYRLWRARMLDRGPSSASRRSKPSSRN